MSLYDYMGITEKEDLTDMWGQSINVGDVLLYPHGSGSSAGSIQVVEVTGIKAGQESADTANWSPVTKEYTYYTAKRTVLHVMGRSAGSKDRPVWLRYPERAVNITDSSFMQFVEGSNNELN